MANDALTELWRWLFATSLLAPVFWIYRCSKQLEALRAVLLGVAFFGVLWWGVLPLLKMAMSGPHAGRFSKALAWGWQQGGGWYKWPGSILLIAAAAGAYAGWWRSAVANPPPHMGATLALRLAIALVPTAAAAWFGYAAFTTGRGDGPVSPATFFFGIALILAIPSMVLLASAFEALVQWMLLDAGGSPAGRPVHSARAVSPQPGFEPDPALRGDAGLRQAGPPSAPPGARSRRRHTQSR